MLKKFLITSFFTIILFLPHDNLSASGGRDTLGLENVEEPDYGKLLQPEFVLKAKYEFDAEDCASRFSVRNSRIGFKGTITSFFSYKAMVELSSDGKFQVLDLYGKFTPFRRLSIILGQNSVPIFNSYTTSPAKLSFANRPFIGKYFLSTRDLGVNILYQIKEKGFPIAIEAGAYNGGGINNPLWVNPPTFGGRILFGSMERGFRSTAKIYRTSAVQQRDYLIWGWDIRYKNEAFKIEAEIMDRYNYFDERDLFASYIQSTYKFDCNGKIFNGIEPALRWDAMGYDFLDNGFGVNRITAGLNFIINVRRVNALFRVDYEQYFKRDDFAEFSENDEMDNNKLTFEFLISF